MMLTTPSPQDTCGSEVTGGRRGDPLIIALLRQSERKQDSDTINLLFVIYNLHFPHYVMEAGRPQRLSPAPGLLSQHFNKLVLEKGNSESLSHVSSSHKDVSRRCF